MGRGIACAAPGQGFGQCIGLGVVADATQLLRKCCPLYSCRRLHRQSSCLPLECTSDVVETDGRLRVSACVVSVNGAYSDEWMVKLSHAPKGLSVCKSLAKSKHSQGCL